MADELDKALEQQMGDAPAADPVTEPSATPPGQGTEVTPGQTPQPEGNRMPEEYMKKEVPVERSGGRIVYKPLDEITRENRTTLQSNYDLNIKKTELTEENTRLRQQLEQTLQTPKQEPPPAQAAAAPEPDPYSPYGEDPQMKNLSDKYNLLAVQLDKVATGQRQEAAQRTADAEQGASNQAMRDIQLYTDALIDTKAPNIKAVPYAGRQQVINLAQEIYNPVDFPGPQGRYQAINEAAKELDEKYGEFRGASTEKVQEQLASNQGVGAQGEGGHQPVPTVELPTTPEGQEAHLKGFLQRHMDST